uniref:zinc metalloproteinase nas-36-like isoform X3 n=2 Tax=Styela clava TaxID=7725 RepID=UPI00193A98C6|nr:zinc metalloproteinase nas-36-like isoform X3 [Styela clava]
MDIVESREDLQTKFDPQAKKRWVVIFISASAIISICAIITVLVVAKTETITVLKDCHVEFKGDPVGINECLKSHCRFDTEVCSSPCPFGYETNDRDCQISCECASEGVFEGDIRFDMDSLPTFLKDYGYVEENFDSGRRRTEAVVSLWGIQSEDGRHNIPYTISERLSSKARSAIESSAKNLSSITCVDFVPRKSEEQHIRFVSKVGCWSGIGKSGATHDISIGVGCENEASVSHELIHVLGFHHEQSRPDRDGYVDILYENIKPAFQSAFAKRVKRSPTDFDAEYDTTSIIHFSGRYFSKNGQPTIMDRSNNEPVQVEKKYLSHQDIYRVNILFKCLPEKPVVEWTEWGNWSACDKTCGEGEKSRFRVCKDAKEEIVEGCEGEKSERIDCENEACPGEWSDWSEFGDCSKECDGGLQWRNRTCNLPDMCEGKDSEGSDCNTQACGADANWQQWSSWSECDKTCGSGNMTRRRQCLGFKNEMSIKCEGSEGKPVIEDKQSCNTKDCEPKEPEGDGWDEWGLWSSCSQTCEGNKSRERRCKVEKCQGNSTEITDCNTEKCEKDLFSEKSKKSNALCKQSSLWNLADFNGDEKADALCKNQDGKLPYLREQATSIYSITQFQVYIFKLIYKETIGNIRDNGNSVKVFIPCEVDNYWWTHSLYCYWNHCSYSNADARYIYIQWLAT